MNSKIDEIVVRLKNSPMYNLSLSSKELFHSNFLYWLGNNNETRKIFDYIIQKLSKYENFELEIETLEREKNKFDLYFESKDGKVFVIENKVKSFPNLKQLKDYQTFKNNADYYILLSLFTTEKNTAPWIKVSYNKLADELEAGMKNLDSTTTNFNLLKNIIQDYIGFIRNLHAISELIQKEKNIKESESCHYKDATLYIHLEKGKTRLEDFYIKAKYAQIAEEVFEQIKNDPIVQQKQLVVGQDANIFEDNIDISVSHGFTRSDGLVDIKVMAKNFVYSIQIQGIQHKRGFESEPKSGIEMPKAIEPLHAEERDWVDFKNINEHPANRNEYNQYGIEFRYKYYNIDKKTTTQNLIDLIVEDTINCLNFLDKRK
jgi:hypothetical protein